VVHHSITTEGEQMFATTSMSPAPAVAGAPAIRVFSVAISGEQIGRVRARVGSTRRAEREPGADRTEHSFRDAV
jgi:hypothetical protein